MSVHIVCERFQNKPDTQNWGLRMGRECRERFPRHQLQRKPLVSDPGKHHGTCLTYMPWCNSGSLTRGGLENVPGIPGACASSNFAHLVRGPWVNKSLGYIRYSYSHNEPHHHEYICIFPHGSGYILYTVQITGNVRSWYLSHQTVYCLWPRLYRYGQRWKYSDSDKAWPQMCFVVDTL